MTRVIIDEGSIEIRIEDSHVFTMTWQVLDHLEKAIKTIRDLNAKKTYKRLDITF